MQPTKKEKDAAAQGGMQRFFRSVTAELKKVNWPSKKELTTYTIVVILTVLVIGFVIWVWDLGLANIFKFMGFYR